MMSCLKMTLQDILLLVFAMFCVRQNAAEKLPFNFGTKTPYQYEDSSFNKPQGCHAVHINMILRHGSRFPSGGDREDFKEILQKLNTLYNSTSAFRYKNLSLPWVWPKEWEYADKSELAERGEKEHYEIAKRYLAKFPEIFENRSYWNKYFQFISTAKERTAQSAMSFAYGLFQNRGPLGAAKFQPVALKFSGPEDDDKVLRPSDACPRYDEEIKDGGGLQEYENFKDGPEIKKVSEKLENKLNVSGKVDIRAEVLFKLCAFGVLLENDQSWCSLFEKEDAEVLQYLNDLEAFYEHSYGHELSYKIICPLVADITDTIKAYAENSLPVGLFRFAHSEAIISLFTILDLFKDAVPLRADNYDKQAARKFSTSQNSPMAANAAFILYQCNSSANAGNNEFKVQLVINEAPVGMPCCYGNSTCSLQKFLSCYEPIGEECDFEAMCQSSKPITRATAVSHAQFRAWNVWLAFFFCAMSNFQ